MALSSGVAPSGNFDLRNWKITLPVDGNGGTSGTAREVTSLSNYQHSSYFYTANDGAMTFRAMVDGATTSGSSYARSELREMNGSSRAAWNLSSGGVMTATLEVDQIPLRSDGTRGKVVVGQIHGADEELVRLYWDAGKTYFVNDRAGSNNAETKFYFKNAAGAQPDISLNERFSYTIDAKGKTLEVTVYADGDVYTSVSTINSYWQTDSLYFKAGAYLGVNESQGKGFAQTSFYDLRFNHTDTALTPTGSSQGSSAPAPSPEPAPAAPAKPPAPAPAPEPTPQEPASSGDTAIPETTRTINGSNSHNYVKGTTGNDTMYGFAGRDVFWGNEGSDVMYGGDDRDADVFMFNTALGKDVDVIMDFKPVDDYFRLDKDVFTKLESGGKMSSDNFAYNSAKDGNDYIIYDQDTGRLFYDADGNGAQLAVEFAVLYNQAQITAADFLVI